MGVTPRLLRRFASSNDEFYMRVRVPNGLVLFGF
jgi:hypothetical protein